MSSLRGLWRKVEVRVLLWWWSQLLSYVCLTEILLLWKEFSFTRQGATVLIVSILVLITAAGSDYCPFFLLLFFFNSLICEACG